MGYAFKRFSEYVEHIGDDYQISSIVFEAYPPQKLCEVAGDTTAFSSRGTHFNCVVVMRWENEGHDAWVREFVKSYTEGGRAIDKEASVKEGRKPVGNVGYGNFSLSGDPTSEWFNQRSFDKLREVKTKWDPNERFTRSFAFVPKAGS